jgi:hypothetical protein
MDLARPINSEREFTGENVHIVLTVYCFEPQRIGEACRMPRASVCTASTIQSGAAERP